MSKLLAVIFVNTALCIREFHKDHTVAHATVNLKDQINVWFTSQVLSPSLIITNNGASVIKSQCWLSHLNAVKKNVCLLKGLGDLTIYLFICMFILKLW